MQHATLEEELTAESTNSPRLTKEDEVRLATEHRSSRQRFVEVISSLPRSWRKRVLRDDLDDPVCCAKWPLGQLELAYQRLLECTAESEDGVLDPYVIEAARCKQRIVRSRETLILANLGLVPHVARSYVNRGISFDDLVQEGNIGLINAVERYDCDRGFRFSTYAVWWIRQSLSRAILEKSRLIRLSRKTWESVTTVKRTAVELTRFLGRRPTKAEIARDAKLSEQAVVKFLAMSREPAPIESVGIDFEREAFDANGTHPLKRVLAREQRDNLIRTLGVLSPKEERLLRLRFGIDDGTPHTLEAIGRIFGVSRERIRQLEQGALRKLRGVLGGRLASRTRSFSALPRRMAGGRDPMPVGVPRHARP